MHSLYRVAIIAVILAGGLGCAAGQTAPAGSSVPAVPEATTPPASPSTPESVSGAAAWERLKGNTITGKIGGQPFSEFFDPAGGVRYVDKDGMSTGTWTVQSAKICFDFPDDDDRSCSTFTVKGSVGSSVDDDGEVMHFTIEPGNSKGL